MVPDLGYAFARFDLDRWAHRWQGALVFDLPAGLLLWLVLRAVSRAAAGRLSPTLRSRLPPPLTRIPTAKAFPLVASLLIGISLHLGWDAFTHTDGWLVQRWVALRQPVLTADSRTLRVCHVLWYASTLGGVYALGAACLRTFDAPPAATPTRPGACHSGPALLLALATVPIAFLHHWFHGWTARVVVAFLSFLVVAGFAGFLAARTRPGQGRPSAPSA
jgi:hypothetical protein